MMPKVTRTGILARPGTYKYRNESGVMVEEIKTAAELKAAAERHPSIDLILGHPQDIEDDPELKDYLGRVDQKWNADMQQVDAVFSFYDEHFDKIPDGLRKRIINHEPLSISNGIDIDEMNDGVQEGIMYKHVALLREGVNPTCPLEDCGINIRRESGKMTKRRYEQETQFTEDSDEDNTDATLVEPGKVVETTDAVPDEKINELPSPPTTEEREPEKKVESEPVEDQVEEPLPEPELDGVPAGVPTSRIKKGWKENDSGHIVIDYQPHKSK